MAPTLKGLQKDGCTITGFLYAGLIRTADGFKVIEFNARLGDPEAEALLPLLENDLITLLCGILDEMPNIKLQWKQQYCLGVFCQLRVTQISQ